MPSADDVPVDDVPVDDMVLRRADFSLSEEQAALRDVFRAALERNCPIECVETAAAADPPGHDEKLWRQLLDMRAVVMGVPTGVGGDGAGLTELVLAAEQHGAFLAPVPLIEATVAARLLARCADQSVAAEMLAAVLDGSRLATPALHHLRDGVPQLVPAGGIADGVIGLYDDTLLLLRRDEPPRTPANHGSTPMAAWDVSDPAVQRDVLATGPDAVTLVEDVGREWRLLMAAALVGIGDAALRRGVDFASHRMAFDVPIATFQAVSHPLVDVAMAVTASRRLVWKAAWYADHEPLERRDLIAMAYVGAVEAATKATQVGVHVQGGLGITVESDMHLFFRRAKGWTLVSGDPVQDLDAVADARYGLAAPTGTGA